MSARPIGEIVRGILAQCEMLSGIQSLLNACETAAARKDLIMQARTRCLIGDEDATLLLQAYQLETA